MSASGLTRTNAACATWLVLVPHAASPVSRCRSLEDISDLQGYVSRSSSILVYCSQGYIQSRNCMIELVSSATLRKPVIALIDQDTTRGGITEEGVYNQLVEAEGSYEKWEFDANTTPSGRALHSHLMQHGPIEWNRWCGHFQPCAVQQCAHS